MEFEPNGVFYCLLWSVSQGFIVRPRTHTLAQKHCSTTTVLMVFLILAPHALFTVFAVSAECGISYTVSRADFI